MRDQGLPHASSDHEYVCPDSETQGQKAAEPQSQACGHPLWKDQNQNLDVIISDWALLFVIQPNYHKEFYVRSASAQIKGQKKYLGVQSAISTKEEIHFSGDQVQSFYNLQKL